MKRIHHTVLFLLVTVVITSCSIIRKTPKTAFTNGFYVQHINNKKTVVYVTVEDEVLHIQTTRKSGEERIIDTITKDRIYPKEKNDRIELSTSFNQYSLDIDFLTIPLKFRPAQKDVPLQLNANLNGAVYVGYRTDKYRVRYVANFLKKSQRTINHYGFSLGGYAGIGNTFMSATNLGNTIIIEYDGVVWTKGIAAIIAVNSFTAGVAFGYDNLLDTNRKNWIYERKPWFGLALGLNLN